MLDLKSLIPWGQKSHVPVKHEEHSDPLVSFRREFDRLFDNFFDGFNGSRPHWPVANGRAWEPVVPTIDVDDADKELVVSAELPGVDEKDIDVTLSGDVLTIKGEKKHVKEDKDESGARHYVERHYGSFSRSMRLPFDAGEQKVGASFDKGVLTIRIAKPADVQSKVKHIEVKSH